MSPTKQKERPVEILVIIIAFWLLLVGAYGGLQLLGARNKQGQRRQAQPAARSRTAAGAKDEPLGGLFSEVDMLRSQVEHLRTEVVALSETATRQERPRTRRYQTGVYADLPGSLRRHVKEARDERHPIGI
jgi:hypothetical protein